MYKRRPYQRRRHFPISGCLPAKITTHRAQELEARKQKEKPNIQKS